MSSRKSGRLFAAILCGMWLSGGRAHAGESSADAPAPSPPLQVSIVDATPARQPVYRAYVTAGTNKFAFLLPGGFRMDAKSLAQNTITLVNTDYTCWITFRIAGPVPIGAKELDPKPCREILLSQHPGATILEEFSLGAASQSGPAFDLHWETSGGVAQAARAVFIPSAAGILEFSLLASRGNLSKFRGSFNSLLVSFRASVDGKLEIPPLPDKS